MCSTWGSQEFAEPRSDTAHDRLKSLPGYHGRSPFVSPDPVFSHRGSLTNGRPLIWCQCRTLVCRYRQCKGESISMLKGHSDRHERQRLFLVQLTSIVLLLQRLCRRYKTRFGWLYPYLLSRPRNILYCNATWKLEGTPDCLEAPPG